MLHVKVSVLCLTQNKYSEIVSPSEEDSGCPQKSNAIKMVIFKTAHSIMTGKWYLFLTLFHILSHDLFFCFLVVMFV